MIDTVRLDRETWRLLERRPSHEPVRLLAKGTSMLPFLREGDEVWIERHPARLRVGDIVVIDLDSVGLALHRVIGARSDAVLIKGDANAHHDGWFAVTAVLGRACALKSPRGQQRMLDTLSERVMARLIARLSSSHPSLSRLTRAAVNLLR